MGLAPKSVDIAREILTEIYHIQTNNKRYESDQYYDGPKSSGSLPIIEYEEDNHLTHQRTGVIMVAGRKSTPGAWENVFINLEDIDKILLDYFYARKKEVPNSDFIEFKKFKKDGIVTLGWF
jgi:hypothetical protein